MIKTIITGKIVNVEIKNYKKNDKEFNILKFAIKETVKQNNDYVTNFYNCTMFNVSNKFAGLLKNRVDIVTVEAKIEINKYNDKCYLDFIVRDLQIISFKNAISTKYAKREIDDSLKVPESELHRDDIPF